MPIGQHMRPQDIEAFKAAAKRFKVWILVRRTNKESIKYIGQKEYVAKRLDCKAKTADTDANLPGGGKVETAGLVVDPTLPGFEKAFKPGKHSEALKEWAGFKPLLYVPESRRPVTYFPGGKLYSVQMDPAKKHYGCVMFSQSSLASAAKFIHGDYDLYAIIPQDNPGTNVRVVETRFGSVPHARGKQFTDVQIFLNSRMGLPLVLHGEQEKYKDHTDEAIDIFCPDGELAEACNRMGLEIFYEAWFEGRKPFAKGAPTSPAGGEWQQI
jgi:hypothetical protein